MADKNQDKTDALINQLCGDLKKVDPLCPYKRILPWLLLSLVYLAGAVAYLGLRHDFNDRLTDGVFIFEMGLAAAIFLSAALASSWLSFPDACQRPTTKAVTLTLFFVFIFWVTSRSIEEGMGLGTTLHVGHCAKEGIIMEIIPILALIFMTMRGRTCQPYWSMGMNILAVSALGWIGLRLTCPMDEMGHSFFNHMLPFAVIGASLGFFARRLFKW